MYTSTAIYSTDYSVLHEMAELTDRKTNSSTSNLRYHTEIKQKQVAQYNTAAATQSGLWRSLVVEHNAPFDKRTASEWTIVHRLRIKKFWSQDMRLQCEAHGQSPATKLYRM